MERKIDFGAAICVVGGCTTWTGAKTNPVWWTVLVSRRAATARWYPDKLQCPGGSLRPNESPLDGAVREMEEETGLKWGDMMSPALPLPNWLGTDGKDHDYLMHFFWTMVSKNAQIPQHREPDKNGPWEWRQLDWLLHNPDELIPGMHEVLTNLKHALEAFMTHKMTKPQYVMILGVREPPVLDAQQTQMHIRTMFEMRCQQTGGSLMVFTNLVKHRLIRRVQKQYWVRTIKGCLAMRRHIINADRNAP